MSEWFGMKAGTATAVAAGSFVAGLLMQGQPLHVRIIAGMCGCAASFVLTPLITPIAFVAWSHIFQWTGTPVIELSRDAVSGFVGFATGLTGIDFCRWLIERSKFALSKLRIPWRK